VVACLLLAGCGSPATPLAHSSASTDELARAVVDAVERRDREALQVLALNEREFREHVWPELPAARPERNLPFSFVWGDLNQKSESGLAQMLERHGGRRYTIAEVRLRGETTRYPTYLVHRDGELTVMDERGAQQHLRLFGSVLEKNGRFKVFSYVVDN
jgi:hypothetical protein